MHISEGQPATGSPIRSDLKNTIKSTTMLINDNKIPDIDMHFNGHDE